jgi:hypothetical protein
VGAAAAGWPQTTPTNRPACAPTGQLVSIDRARIHGELSELVRGGQPLERAVDGASTVKYLVEELGIPHTEYGGVRVNGVAAHDGHQVQDGNVVDICPAEPPAPPVTEPRFVLDVHLGTLARYMCLLGFDTAYDNHAGDEDLFGPRGRAEARTLLTRDRGLLRRRVITDARLARGTDPLAQLVDLVDSGSAVEGWAS